MNKKNNIRLGIVTLLLLAWISSFAQLNNIKNESYFLISDRSIYGAGETIYFSAMPRRIYLTPEDKTISQVYYCDIVSQNGEVIASEKFKANREGISGSITIPDNILSGNYLLRGYTRWMRNFPHENFQYIPLILIHPESPGFTDVFKENELMQETVVTDGFSISISNPYVLKREKVNIEIAANDQKIIPDNRNICIAVLKKGFQNYGSHALKKGIIKEKTTQKQWFLPEIYGPTLSAQVSNGSSVNFELSRINLSMSNGYHELVIARINNRGKVFFQLPNQTGKNDMYLLPEHRDIELQIDRDFAKSRNFNPYMRAISDDDSIFGKKVSQFVFYKQLAQLYSLEQKNDVAIEANALSEKPFYGKAIYQYKMDDFILLGSFAEYLRDLMPQVKLTDLNGDSRLVLLTEKGSILGYTPLLLIDHVPTSLDNLLKLDPRILKKVDIVNKRYIKGSETFDGILSVFTKSGDFGSVEFPANGHFFEYKLLSRVRDYKRNLPGKDFLPDLNPVLAWHSGMKMDDEYSCRTQIVANDIPGIYVIVVSAISNEGVVLQSSAEFTVK